MKDLPIQTEKAAELCGITERRIRQLIDESKLPPLDNAGKLPLVATLTGYIRYLQASKAGDDPDFAKHHANYECERAMKLKVHREIAELELATMRKELWSLKQFQEATFQMEQEARTSLWQRIVDQLPALVNGLDVEATRERCKQIVNEILEKRREWSGQWNP